jgi:hypothetical protein
MLAQTHNIPKKAHPFQLEALVYMLIAHGRQVRVLET